MTALIAAIGTIAMGILGIFFLCLLSTFLGGVSFWIIGGVFEYIPEFIQIHTGFDYTNFETGALIGFFTSVVRSMFYRGD